MSSLRVNLVVAACNNNGIGVNGKLPWSLRKDMAFFKKITTETIDPGKQNVVIMGRKTWFSIPEKFRPLKNRVNIVLSRELKEIQDGVYVCHSFEEAVNLASQGSLGETKIENVHVIGGSSVYEEAMRSKFDCRIYLTRIMADIKCDTFLPSLDENTFRKVENPGDLPTQDVQEENGIKFKFEVYEKPIRKADTEGIEPSKPMGEADTKGVVQAQSLMEEDKQFQPITFNVMAAVCGSNRGIGYRGKLPWPYLKRDHEYYIKKTSTMSGQNSDGKMIIHIQGRVSWEGCRERERNLKHVCRVLITSDRDILESHPCVLTVVPSFEAAVIYCSSPGIREKIDSVWIMGGSRVYEEAIHHSVCDRLFVTHIHNEFPADVFFPKFDHLFQETSGEVDTPDILEQDNITFQFRSTDEKTKKGHIMTCSGCVKIHCVHNCQFSTFQHFNPFLHYDAFL